MSLASGRPCQHAPHQLHDNSMVGSWLILRDAANRHCSSVLCLTWRLNLIANNLWTNRDNTSGLCMQGWAGLNNTFQVVLVDVLGNPYRGSDPALLEVAINPTEQPAAGVQAGSDADHAAADQLLAANVLDISR